MCPTLWPHGLQHARLPCPSPTSRACSNSCALILVMPSNHLILFRPLYLLPSIFPSLRVFSNEPFFFTSGGQSIGASASASVLPINIQDWFPLGLTDLISLQSKGLSRVFFKKQEFLETGMPPSTIIPRAHGGTVCCHCTSELCKLEVAVVAAAIV